MNRPSKEADLAFFEGRFFLIILGNLFFNRIICLYSNIVCRNCIDRAAPTAARRAKEQPWHTIWTVALTPKTMRPFVGLPDVLRPL